MPAIVLTDLLKVSSKELWKIILKTQLLFYPLQIVSKSWTFVEKSVNLSEKSEKPKGWRTTSLKKSLVDPQLLLYLLKIILNGWSFI